MELRSMYRGGWGDKWVTEEARSVSLPLETQADTMLHVHE
jgi:hypothetical protein